MNNTFLIIMPFLYLHIHTFFYSDIILNRNAKIPSLLCVTIVLVVVVLYVLCTLYFVYSRIFSMKYFLFYIWIFIVFIFPCMECFFFINRERLPTKFNMRMHWNGFGFLINYCCNYYYIHYCEHIYSISLWINFCCYT